MPDADDDAPVPRPHELLDDEMLMFLQGQKGKMTLGGVDVRTLVLVASLAGGGTLAGTTMTSWFGVASQADVEALGEKHDDLLVAHTALTKKHAEVAKEMREYTKEAGQINRRLDAIELRAGFTVELLKLAYPKAASSLPQPPPDNP